MTEFKLFSGQEVIRVQCEQYPDAMPLIRGDISGRAVIRMLVKPLTLHEFAAAMFLVDAIRWRGGAVFEIVLPSIPGGRQDRLNDSGDILFTLRSVANMLNERKFARVITVDPHSEVTTGLINRCFPVKAADCINPPVGKYAAVVSPDAGAEKRAQAVATKLGVPLLHAWKTRDVSTGNISGFGMQSHTLSPGSLVLVVDDICDAGGTFLGLADVLDAAGLKAHLWVSHGLFTKGTKALLARYGHVYCTDSVYGPRDGIIEIQVCDKLLKGEAP